MRGICERFQCQLPLGRGEGYDIVLPSHTVPANLFLVYHAALSFSPFTLVVGCSRARVTCHITYADRQFTKESSSTIAWTFPLRLGGAIYHVPNVSVTVVVAVEHDSLLRLSPSGERISLDMAAQRTSFIHKSILCCLDGSSPVLGPDGSAEAIINVKDAWIERLEDRSKRIPCPPTLG